MREKKNITKEIERIKKFYSTYKRLPTYREICEICKFKSTNQAARLVDRLVEEGVLSKDSTGRLSPKRLFSALMPLTAVQAGFPSPSEEDLLDAMSFDEYLLKDNHAPFILKVMGESMIDVGIFEGDMILVEMSGNWKVGDIVVARVEGGYTVKYLAKDPKGRLYLKSANKAFKPIYPTEQSDIEIKAIVRWVLRKI